MRLPPQALSVLSLPVGCRRLRDGCPVAGVRQLQVLGLCPVVVREGQALLRTGETPSCSRDRFFKTSQTDFSEIPIHQIRT